MENAWAIDSLLFKDTRRLLHAMRDVGLDVDFSLGWG